MTGYLAVSPEGLEVLQRALGLAGDELDSFRAADPEAAAALRHVARARSRLDPWPRRLQAIACCDALVRAFEGVAGAFERPGVPPGFAILHDELDAVTPDELELVGAVLAHRLEHWSGDPLDTPELLALLAPLTAQPALAAPLLRALGPAATAELLDVLGQSLRFYPDALLHPGEQFPAAADALRLLGPGFAVLLDEAPATWVPILEAGDPYVTARLLAEAFPRAADAEAWVPIATHCLGSLFAGDAAPDTLEDPFWRDGAGYVLRAVAADPRAARSFVMVLPREDLARVLLEVDQELAGALLLASADPAVFEPDEVRPSLLTVVGVLGGWAAGAGYPWYEQPAAPWPAPDRTATWESGGDTLPGRWQAVPHGLGLYLAPYLAKLLAPAGLLAWQGRDAMWDLAGHDDDLTRTLVLAMGEDPSEVELRTAAWELFTSAYGGTVDDYAQGAYVVGVVENAGRIAGYQQLDHDAAEAEMTLALVNRAIGALPLAALFAGAGIPALFAGVTQSALQRTVSWALSPPDPEHARRREDAAAGGIGTVAGLTAVGLYAAELGIDPTTLPEGPTEDELDAAEGERADAAGVRVVGELEVWMDDQGLDAGQRAHVTDLYDGASAAARAGSGMIGG